MVDPHPLVARIEQLLTRYQELEKKHMSVCNELARAQAESVALRSKLKQVQIRMHHLLDSLPTPETSSSSSIHETY